MAKPSFSPKFLRAAVKFEFEGNSYGAGEQLINANGIPGFNWKEFDPMLTVGKQVTVEAELFSLDPNQKKTIRCLGRLICEQAAKSSQLAIAIKLSEEDRTHIDKAIAAEGALPEYVRKFPRIGFDERIQSMPTLAILRMVTSEADITTALEVENLSPTGFQMTTEDARVEVIKPGDIVTIELLPRGLFVRSVVSACEIRRIVRSVDLDTQNRRWAFGASVVTMDDADKLAFTEILRAMVVQIQKDGI